MSAEVVVKKRGRPKKITTETEAEVEEIVETSKKSTTRKTKAATAKKTPAKKVVQVEEEKPILPQKSKSSVLEQVKKLELSKGKNNPTTKAADLLAHSSTAPTITLEKPIQTSTAPISASASEAPPAREIFNTSTSDSKILNQVRALSNEANSPDKVEPIVKETIEKTVSESSTQAPLIQNTKVADVLLKEAAISTTSIHSTEESTMAKLNGEPAKPRSPTAALPAEPKPKIPITALNSKIVSDISARGGARISPLAGGTGKLPPNYKPMARKITRTIIALPILIVTSYVLYERLALGEEQKQITRVPMILKGKKEEELRDSKSSSTTE